MITPKEDRALAGIDFPPHVFLNDGKGVCLRCNHRKDHELHVPEEESK